MHLPCTMCPSVTTLLVFLSSWGQLYVGSLFFLERQLSREQWQSRGLSVVPTPGDTGKSPPCPEFDFLPVEMGDVSAQAAVKAGHTLTASLTTPPSHTCTCTSLLTAVSTPPLTPSHTCTHTQSHTHTQCTHTIIYPCAHTPQKDTCPLMLAHTLLPTLSHIVGAQPHAHTLTLTLPHMYARTRTHVLQEALSLPLWPQHLVI